jgi:uncharacterized protein (DUF1015 family)
VILVPDQRIAADGHHRPAAASDLAQGAPPFPYIVRAIADF